MARRTLCTDCPTVVVEGAGPSDPNPCYTVCEKCRRIRACKKMHGRDRLNWAFNPESRRKGRKR